MSAGGEQRPAVTVKTTVTNHVITVSCRVEMWSPRRRLPRPLTYLSSRLSIPHTPCSSHCSPLPPLGEGRRFPHLLSCVLFHFHSQLFHTVSSCLLLTYHLSVTSPSESLSTVPELTTSWPCPRVCVPCQVHNRNPINIGTFIIKEMIKRSYVTGVCRRDGGRW